MSRKEQLTSFIKWLLSFLSVILAALIICSLITPAYARNSKKGPGVNFIARGTLWPQTVIEQINKTLDKLRAAEVNFKGNTKRYHKVIKMLTRQKASLLILQQRIKSLEQSQLEQSDLDELWAEIDKTQANLKVLEAQLKKLARNAGLRDNYLLNGMEQNRLQIEKLKDKFTDMLKAGWGFEAFTQAASNWGPFVSTGQAGDAILLFVGGTFYIFKNKTWFRLSAGAGLETINRPVLFSWQLQTSLEYRVDKYVLLGPVMALEYAMAPKLDGSQTWLWTLGGRFRVHMPWHTRLSATVDGTMGLYALYESYSINIRVALGLSYDIGFL
jgi:hypothetical protein